MPQVFEQSLFLFSNSSRQPDAILRVSHFLINGPQNKAKKELFAFCGGGGGDIHDRAKIFAHDEDLKMEFTNYILWYTCRQFANYNCNTVSVL